MNRRLALTNTECGLIIGSPELAADVAQLLQRNRLKFTSPSVSVGLQ